MTLQAEELSMVVNNLVHLSLRHGKNFLFHPGPEVFEGVSNTCGIWNRTSRCGEISSLAFEGRHWKYLEDWCAKLRNLPIAHLTTYPPPPFWREKVNWQDIYCSCHKIFHGSLFNMLSIKNNTSSNLVDVYSLLLFRWVHYLHYLLIRPSSLSF